MRAMVTGVSGWVGDLLSRRLVEEGHDVVGFSRDPSKLSVDFPVVRGDASTGEGLDEALEGAQVAWYFIHSLESSNPEGFAARDRRAAENFAAAVQKAGVERVVFLSVIMREGDLSQHLASRLEVERTLCAATPTSTAVRVSTVVDSRSPGFRFLLRMARKVPVIPRTPAGANLQQPIDARDAVSALLAAGTWEGAKGEPIDVPGPETVTFTDLMTRITSALGLEREVVDVPAMDPEVAAPQMAQLTGDDPAYIAPLMTTMNGGDLLARHDGAEILGIERRGLDEAIEHTVAEHLRLEPEAEEAPA